MKSETNRPAMTPTGRLQPRRQFLRRLGWLLAIWGVAAYLLIPWVSKKYFQHQSKFTGVPRVTQTGDGHPGDPLNLAFVGAELDLIHALTATGWYPADPITFRSSVRIAVDSVFRKPDDEAPVSNLFLFGRKQDLAFEQPVGNGPRQRHHVRFWRWDQLEDGRPVWFGSATFDERVGLSYATAQVTHHIGPDVDAERDRMIAEFQTAGWVRQVRWVDNFHQPPEGRNGGGDLWRTDGRLAVVVLLGEPAGAITPTNDSPRP